MKFLIMTADIIGAENCKEKRDLLPKQTNRGKQKLRLFKLLIKVRARVVKRCMLVIRQILVLASTF